MHSQGAGSGQFAGRWRPGPLSRAAPALVLRSAGRFPAPDLRPRARRGLGGPGSTQGARQSRSSDLGDGAPPPAPGRPPQAPARQPAGPASTDSRVTGPSSGREPAEDAAALLLRRLALQEGGEVDLDAGADRPEQGEAGPAPRRSCGSRRTGPAAAPSSGHQQPTARRGRRAAAGQDAGRRAQQPPRPAVAKIRPRSPSLRPSRRVTNS